MAAPDGFLKAKLLVQVDGYSAYEIGTMEIPVSVTLEGSSLGVKNIDIRRPLAHALKVAGANILSGLAKADKATK